MLMKIDYTLVLKNGKEVRIVRATNNIEIDNKKLMFWDLWDGTWYNYEYYYNEQVEYIKDLKIEKVDSDSEIEPIKEIK